MNRILTVFTTIYFMLFSGGSIAWGQIQDNFSDGNFSADPSWQGNADHFIVNAAGELQLNAPDAGTSALAVQGNIPDSAIWNFRLRMEFAPSASNLLRVYLQADKADLADAQGYMIEMGENGSGDALRLYRQDGAAKVLLGTGFTGFVAGDPVDIRVRAKRTKSGEWTIEAAAANGALQQQITVTDATYSGGADRFFGFQCVFSATRKDKYFFDDISVLPDLPDNKPPVLVTVQADNALQISLAFDEAVDSSSAVDLSHYTISGGVTAAKATWQTNAPNAVILSLASPMATGNYALQAMGVTDKAGNASSTQSLDFQYLEISPAAEFDVLINEIMADPSPSVGLPEVEWVELYNRSTKYIQLQSLRFTDGGAPQPLPAGILPPNGYAVLCTPANAAALSPVANNVYGVLGFPSLNNDGDPLQLLDEDANLIDQVSYRLDWHTNPGKEDGGWSLERINPLTPCVGKANWHSCPVSPGGTPGAANASLQQQPDVEGPRIISAVPLDDNTLNLTFSEGLDKVSGVNPSGYRLDPPRAIASVTINPADRAQVTLELAEPLIPSILYALTATSALTDCSGVVAIQSDTVFLGLPEIPDPQDIVINELLFNPSVGGARFVEVYNRSSKIFNWPDFTLVSNLPSVSPEPITVDRLFLPGEYAVFTTAPNDITNRFANVRSDRLFEQELPSLTEKVDNIILRYTKSGQVIDVDAFEFSTDLHNSLLSSSEQEGVSLERIRADEPTHASSNWTSAARVVGYDWGTPTQPNSQQRGMNSPNGDDWATLAADRLSPDGDGYEDFLEITYQLPGAGYSATLTVFDSGGNPVKRLVRQELIGTQGNLRWEGDTDDDQRARPGIYILFLEIFNNSGDLRQLKKPFALVQKF